MLAAVLQSSTKPGNAKPIANKFCTPRGPLQNSCGNQTFANPLKNKALVRAPAFRRPHFSLGENGICKKRGARSCPKLRRDGQSLILAAVLQRSTKTADFQRFSQKVHVSRNTVKRLRESNCSLPPPTLGPSKKQPCRGPLQNSCENHVFQPLKKQGPCGSTRLS